MRRAITFRTLCFWFPLLFCRRSPRPNCLEKVSLDKILIFLRRLGRVFLCDKTSRTIELLTYLDRLNSRERFRICRGKENICVRSIRLQWLEREKGSVLFNAGWVVEEKPEGGDVKDWPGRWWYRWHNRGFPGPAVVVGSVDIRKSGILSHCRQSTMKEKEICKEDDVRRVGKLMTKMVICDYF